MKNILVLMHDDGGQEARFQAAVDVTRAVNGHLTCLDVVTLPVTSDTMLGAGGLLIAEERSTEFANRQRMEARLECEGVSWNWIDTVGDFAGCLERSADLADLIVINRKLDDKWGPDMYGLVGELLVRANRPLLAVPDTGTGVDVCGRVLVAWDASSTAAVALRAATPLLMLAEAIDVVEVGRAAGTEPSLEAAQYLSRHGLAATIVDVPDARHPPGQVLAKMAASGRYAYVVMGGFGHRRFVEALLGGVTRHMLRHSAIPLFLAH